MAHARSLAAGLMLALGVFVLLAAPSAAELRPPQIIDAATGEDAIALGATIGEREGWAAFMQETNGVNRLYVAHAQDGVFEPPEFADAGEAIKLGGLVGSGQGEAVVVFSQVVNNFDVIFGRRLENGQLGPIEQISPNNENAEFANAMFPFDRDLSLAMNAGGAAVLCYSAGGKDFAATLPEGGQEWTEREFPDGCFSPGIDSRGNVVALGRNANDDLVANRLVGGQLTIDVVEPDVMDQENLAVGPSGVALAVGRDDGFHVFARRKLDIAQGGAWERVGGNLEENLMQGANSSPEDPFATLDAQGNGLVAFRDNRMVDANDPDNNPLGYYRQVSGGEPGAGGVLGQTPSRIRLAQDALGTSWTSYPSIDSESAFIRELSAGALGDEMPLAPGEEPYLDPNMAGFAASQNGNLVALVEPLGPPRRVAAVVDFTPPAADARCRGKAATFIGTPGRDKLRGTPGDDVIVARGGNDEIRGGGGHDSICAGKGKDRVVGGRGKDRLVGGKGKDRLLGGRGKDRLFGGKGKDRLIGGKGKDRCVGGRGRDVLKRCG